MEGNDIRLKLIAGYRGKYGTVTASYDLDMPFLPPEGCVIQISNNNITRVLSLTECPYSWDQGEQLMSILCEDHGDESFPNVLNLSDIRHWYKAGAYQISGKGERSEVEAA